MNLNRNSTEKSYIHVKNVFHGKYPLSSHLNPFAKSFISSMDTNKNIIDARNSVMETSPVANYLSTPILSERSDSEDICSQLNNLSDDLRAVNDDVAEMFPCNTTRAHDLETPSSLRVFEETNRRIDMACVEIDHFEPYSYFDF